MTSFFTKAKLVFVGDLVNKGPKSAECIRIAREHSALCIKGNHELATLGVRAWQHRGLRCMRRGLDLCCTNLSLLFCCSAVLLFALSGLVFYYERTSNK